MKLINETGSTYRLDRQTDGQTDTERERERAFSTQNGLEGAVNNYV